ncbi:hypothetical protein B4N89_36975 [Embleya scabrispora]|uniref:(S)-ureidoglycine aminohydrolase cupin domain-containing protein n=1 Tax=Embleya scabrispora TaxID=159449 RepID=A0A1T3NMC1_9ACTN|nr:cupin domain-containing protein [Embleya scabrispora]OPC77860.1 hypothetical protein B4N89_36975 [Embleya scabrispora]
MDHAPTPDADITVTHAPDHPLTPLPIDPADVLSGDPVTSFAVLREDDHAEHGLWQMTPGSAAGVEADEMFVVLAGRATIDVRNGPTLDVKPGDVGLMRAGTHAVWTVHETLRKAYRITKPTPG